MAGSLYKTDKKSSPPVGKQKNAVSTESLTPQCAKNNLNIRKKEPVTNEADATALLKNIGTHLNLLHPAIIKIMLNLSTIFAISVSLFTACQAFVCMYLAQKSKNKTLSPAPTLTASCFTRRFGIYFWDSVHTVYRYNRQGQFVSKILN